MSEGDLGDAVVILSGGTGLLGRHYATSLSEKDARVVVAEIDENSAQAVVDGPPGAEGMTKP
jgi:S-adenosylhomocysteine hydrolase